MSKKVWPVLTGLGSVAAGRGSGNSLATASSSFDITEYQRTNFGTILDNHGEDKWISKALLNWQMTSSNQLAAGTEFGYYWLDQPTIFMGPAAVVGRRSA